MWDLAYAQTGPAGSGPPLWTQLLPLFLILVIFYFLLIRPQQKKVKEHRELLAKLKKNDEVMTSGGIYGKIVSLSDSMVTLEVAPNVRIRVHRPQIAAVIKGEKPSGKDAKEQ